jgi:hypothetical protein
MSNSVKESKRNDELFSQISQGWPSPPLEWVAYVFQILH